MLVPAKGRISPARSLGKEGLAALLLATSDTAA
jgi:hypothetical protein